MVFEPEIDPAIWRLRPDFAAFSVAVMAALQRRVPDHVRGRLLAL